MKFFLTTTITIVILVNSLKAQNQFQHSTSLGNFQIFGVEATSPNNLYLNPAELQNRVTNQILLEPTPIFLGKFSADTLNSLQQGISIELINRFSINGEEHYKLLIDPTEGTFHVGNNTNTSFIDFKFFDRYLNANLELKSESIYLKESTGKVVIEFQEQVYWYGQPGNIIIQCEISEVDQQIVFRYNNPFAKLPSTNISTANALRDFFTPIYLGQLIVDFGIDYITETNVIFNSIIGRHGNSANQTELQVENQVNPTVSNSNYHVFNDNEQIVFNLNSSLNGNLGSNFDCSRSGAELITNEVYTLTISDLPYSNEEDFESNEIPGTGFTITVFNPTYGFNLNEKKDAYLRAIEDLSPGLYIIRIYLPNGDYCIKKIIR